MKLVDKVALITGASMGMGKGHAETFIAEGETVYLADINDENSLATATELADKAHFVHFDVTNEEDWQTAMATIEANDGVLDILVNNAGISVFLPLSAMTKDQYMKSISFLSSWA